VRFSLKINAHGQAVDYRLRTSLDLARRAETLGFHAVYCIDHYWLPRSRLGGYTTLSLDRPTFPDSWMLLAAIAAETERVRLGPQVTPIGLRHPVDIARWGATLDNLSQGRFVLGVGAGHQAAEYTNFGHPFPPFAERFARMLEGIEVIRKLWTVDGPVSFEGQFYRLDGAELWPKPLEWPGIWLGGTSERIRTAVAEHADGWVPAGPQHGQLDPGFFRDAMQQIRAGTGAHGRTIGAGLMMYAGVPDSAEATRTIASMLRRRTDWAELSDGELLEEGPVLVGSTTAIRERIARYEDAGVEELTLSFVPLDDITASQQGLEAFGERIIPSFSN
jgi:probable F420-dependent oxidoreductase